MPLTHIFFNPCLIIVTSLFDEIPSNTQNIYYYNISNTGLVQRSGLGSNPGEGAI